MFSMKIKWMQFEAFCKERNYDLAQFTCHLVSIRVCHQNQVELYRENVAKKYIFLNRASFLFPSSASGRRRCTRSQPEKRKFNCPFFTFTKKDLCIRQWEFFAKKYKSSCRKVSDNYILQQSDAERDSVTDIYPSLAFVYAVPTKKCDNCLTCGDVSRWHPVARKRNVI